MRPRDILRGVAAGLFVLSLPVLFGTITVRWMVSDTGWYRAGFARYGVSERTGIPPDELAGAAEKMSEYLLLRRDSVDIDVRIGGEARPLLNEREILHMRDVQNILRVIYDLQTASAAYTLLYLAASRIWLRERYRSDLGSKLRWGGAITLGMFGAAGALSLLDFGELFLLFHLALFDNDLWILDPARDNLIMMFPQGFWYDSAMRLALASSAQALGAVVVGSLLARKPSAVSPSRKPSGDGR